MIFKKKSKFLKYGNIFVQIFCQKIPKYGQKMGNIWLDSSTQNNPVYKNF